MAVFLIVSECSLFRGFFARNWPLLSPSHGFVFLGTCMMVLGLNMLGNMNKEATSQKSLGLPFWRLLVASGILAIVIGFFNIIAVSSSLSNCQMPSLISVQSYVFRDKARHITARRVRSHGAISLTEIPADIEADPKLKAFTISTHHTGSSSSRTGTPATRMGTPPVDMGSPHLSSPHKENRFSQFDFSPLRALRNARQSILPSYHSSSPTKGLFQARRTSSIYSRSTSGQTKRSFWLKRSERRDSDVPHVPEISAPLNVNPQFAHLVKPNLAHHPSVRRPEAEFDKI